MISVTLTRAQWRHVIECMAVTEQVQDALLGTCDYPDAAADKAAQDDSTRRAVRIAIRGALRSADDAQEATPPAEGAPHA